MSAASRAQTQARHASVWRVAVRVECPLCGAPESAVCVTLSGNEAGQPHASRYSLGRHTAPAVQVNQAEGRYLR